MTLEQQQELDAFLASVEKRAFRMIQLATSNSDDALDILQDAMFKLVEKYAGRDVNEWGPLFSTILQSKINDWYRRNNVRNRFRTWLGFGDEQEEDPIQSVPDHHGRSPEQVVQTDRCVDELEQAIQCLPLRQQQAFLLRSWDGYSVKETAKIMKCSEGSVKTHTSRALEALRKRLGDHWP